MLINCPECNKEISDKAIICVHCGFPVSKEIYSCNINGKTYNLSRILSKIDAKESKMQVINTIYEIKNMEFSDAERLYDIIVKTGKIPNKFTCKQIPEKEGNSNIVKCPTCGSTNVKKLSTFYSTGFSPKYFECDNCGYMW